MPAIGVETRASTSITAIGEMLGQVGSTRTTVFGTHVTWHVLIYDSALLTKTNGDNKPLT